MTYSFTHEDLKVLTQWDTPTICNALELLVPERRAFGFTVEPMVALHPGATPIVGLARVATVRAKEPPRGEVADRMAWHEYVANASLPAIGGRVGPSHAHVHVVDFGKPVDIFGMQVTPDDVIHADEHGAMVIPAECVKRRPEKVDLVSRREKVILDLSPSPDFSTAPPQKALAVSRAIH